MKADFLKKRAIIVPLTVIIIMESLLLHYTPVVFAEDEFHQFELILYSNVVDLQSISVYEKDGEYYIEVSKLADLTRSKLSDRPTYCYLTQGVWTVSLDFLRQLLEDKIQKSEINLYQVNDLKLVPAVELLSYFGATYVNIDIKDKKFYCIMPNYTAWEALNVDYGLSLDSIYSKKGYETVARVFEVMTEYVMGDGTTPEGYRKRAYNEVSQLDMLSLSGVKEFISRIQEENEQFLESDRGECIANKINNNGLEYSEEEDFLKSIIDTEKDAVDIMGLLTKGHLVLVRYLFSNQRNWLREATGKKYTKSYTKHSIDALNATLDTIEKDNAKVSLSLAAASAILNMASSSINEMKSVQSSNNLIGTVMGRDDLDSLGIELDTSWIKTAKKYNKKSSILTSNLIRAVIEQVINEGTDKGLDILFKESGAAAQIGLIAGRKLMEKSPLTGGGYEESKADLSAIILCDLQIELLKIIARYYECIDFSNKEDVEKLINASAMYCRTTIVMYQEMSKANTESKKKQDLYQEKIDSAAISLYKIMTFAEDGIDDIVPRYYSEIKEEIDKTRENWLVKDESQTPTDAGLVMDLYNKAIADYDRLMQEGERRFYEERSEEYSSGRKTYYAVEDIDNNGIDELILRYDYPDQSHLTNFDSGYGETTFVYTVTGGILTKIISPENEGYNPENAHDSFIRIYKGSNLINNGMQHVPGDHVFYRYQNGELSSNPVLELTMGGVDPGIWLLNNEEVSREECVDAYNNAVNGDEGYELQLYEKETNNYSEGEENESFFSGVITLKESQKQEFQANGNRYSVEYITMGYNNESALIDIFVNGVIGAFRLEGIWYASIENVYVTDIDITDSFANVAVVVYGEDDESETYLFAFNDSEIQEMGYFKGRLLPDSINGDGKILLQYWIGMGIHDYGSFAVRPEIEVHDLSAELVKLHSGRTVYSGTEVIYEEEFRVPLYSELTVYSEPSCTSVAGTIPAGNSVICEYVQYGEYDHRFYVSCGDVTGYVTSHLLKVSCDDIYFVG